MNWAQLWSVELGTPAYLAPEVILITKGKTYDGKVSISMWQLLGCVCKGKVAAWGVAFEGKG